MADLKISQLTGATTPLAGTEVVPLVQSSTTKKVAVSDLTAGRQVAMAGCNSSDNLLVSAGKGLAWSGNAATYITPEDNAQGARIAAGGSFLLSVNGGNTVLTFDATTKNGTWSLGNLVQGTAAKGINFTANTGAANMTSQLLNWYEEGTFTPTYGGSTTNPTVTYTDQIGYYTRIGRVVTIGIRLVVTSATGGSGNLIVNGLPFTGLANTGGLSLQFVLGFASNVLQPALSGTSLILYDTYAGTSNTQSPVSALTSAGGTTYLVLGGTYMV